MTSSISVAEIMDKTPKTHKPQSRLENIPFLNGHHSPTVRARELFKSVWMGKDL